MIGASADCEGTLSATMPNKRKRSVRRTVRAARDSSNVVRRTSRGRALKPKLPIDLLVSTEDCFQYDSYDGIARQGSDGESAELSGRKQSVPVRDEAGRFVGIRPKTAAEKAQLPIEGAGGVFKSAAVLVLTGARQLLTTGEITRQALQQGLLGSHGKTPEATMASALYTDVKRKERRSIFIRPVEGLFGLREWVKSGCTFDSGYRLVEPAVTVKVGCNSDSERRAAAEPVTVRSGCNSDSQLRAAAEPMTLILPPKKCRARCSWELHANAAAVKAEVDTKTARSLTPPGQPIRPKQPHGGSHTGSRPTAGKLTPHEKLALEDGQQEWSPARSESTALNATEVGRVQVSCQKDDHCMALLLEAIDELQKSGPATEGAPSEDTGDGSQEVSSPTTKKRKLEDSSNNSSQLTTESNGPSASSDADLSNYTVEDDGEWDLRADTSSARRH